MHKDGTHKGGMKGPRGAMGQVTAKNGTTLTVLGANGTTYTVDAASTTVTRVVTTSLAEVNVGDTIHAHGPTNGTTVTAAHIMDDVQNMPDRPQRPHGTSTPWMR